jgi:hypothetical protein
MSRAVMTERIAEASPRSRAGISGLGVVSGDAAATANTILAHEPSFRWGFALGLISTALLCRGDGFLLSVV